MTTSLGTSFFKGQNDNGPTAGACCPESIKLYHQHLAESQDRRGRLQLLQLGERSAPSPTEKMPPVFP